MTCQYCSREISEDSVICPYCGGVLYAPEEAEAPASAMFSRKEFFKTACSNGIRKGINIIAIVLYAFAGLLIISELMSGKLSIAGFVIVGLTIWVQKTKSRTAAIVLLVYVSLATVFGLSIGMLVMLAAAIVTMIFVNKGEKEWKAYEEQFN